MAGVGINVRDASMKQTKALPAAASTTVNGTALDLMAGGRSDFTALCEFLVSAPALTTTMAPDTRTMTYKLEDSADNSSFATIPGLSAVIVQTGAGGAGAAATTWRGKPPSNVRRYVRLVVVSGASIADSSAVSSTFELLF